jgi:hypothetical protein
MSLQSSVLPTEYEVKGVFYGPPRTRTDVSGIQRLYTHSSSTARSCLPGLPRSLRRRAKPDLRWCRWSIYTAWPTNKLDHGRDKRNPWFGVDTSDGVSGVGPDRSSLGLIRRLDLSLGRRRYCPRVVLAVPDQSFGEVAKVWRSNPEGHDSFALSRRLPSSVGKLHL